MASSDLRVELDCAVCLNIYTDPVMLKCGHNFCRLCIERVLDTQGELGVYSCPQCREEFQERPALHRNIALRNISQQILHIQPEKKENGVFCTYCIHASVVAVKSCLHCEASLCDNHLKVHSKSPEHVLCDPTASLQNRKCSIHKKILEYYCNKDSACICTSCTAIGEHRGHQVDTLHKAFTKKKTKLVNNLQQLIIKREETEKRVRALQERCEEAHEKANDEAERVNAAFVDLRRRLEDLEKRVLSEISRQEEQYVRPLNDLIRDLELKKDKLSRKIRHIEVICNMMDPLTALQQSDRGVLCDTADGDDKEKKTCDQLLQDGGDLDVCGIPHMLRTGLFDIITGLYGGIYIQKAANIFLDEDTAHNYLQISYDQKTASRSGTYLNRPDTLERFNDQYQVRCSESFSSGRYYWEVDVSKSNNWIIGMCYDSIEESLIGYDDVSWGLSRRGKSYMVIHDGNETKLDDNLPCYQVRVYLDYEAGQISFYICDPIEHLHTFTADFTEPLYPALGVWHASISLC